MVTETCKSAKGSRQRPRKRPNLELIGLRINAGLSREALALRVGTSRETIRSAECGHVPGPHLQSAIATVFQRRPLDIWPIETQRGVR